MHFKKLKVRPRKNVQAIYCAKELSTMLSCWAASGDIHSASACAESATTLFECMRTAPIPVKTHRPSINYHLARLNKYLK
ncbi:hypothetical protein QCA50_002799 [Cerrena zonata]|uniref:37S ribosomal protein mrp10, mitochondrial n=1 Tax=Cerrena zonata TaxID=2478898 RepID=A0AAW0GIR4_9APHY